MGSKHKTLADLFHHQLKDVFDAERHAGKTLAKLAKACASPALRDALDRRHDAVAARLERLELVFEAIDKKAHGLPCEAMKGLTEEAKELVESFEDAPALDDGAIAAAQAIEHYFVARYMALRLWAGRLGLEAVSTPLDATLGEVRRDLDQWTLLSKTVADEGPSEAGPLTLKQAALMGLG